MYTLLINSDHSISHTKITTIMQRSLLVDDIQVLVSKIYNNIDWENSTCWLKYILPVSKKIKLMSLKQGSANYNGQDYLQYVIPGNTSLTAEKGYVEMSFTFTKLVPADGDQVETYVRKTQPTQIYITPVAAFEEYDPDELLCEVDQRLLLMEAKVKDIDTLHQEMFDNAVNDVRLDLENQKLLLASNKGDVGSGVDIKALSEAVAQNVIGLDADGVNDGITYLDEVAPNVKVVDLDPLVK